jgi:predicted DNA-binding transcriptional regulator AlpA
MCPTTTRNQPTLPKFVSRRQGADLMAISVATFDRLRRRPDFPRAYKVGPRSVRFRTADLYAFMRRCQAR